MSYHWYKVLMVHDYGDVELGSPTRSYHPCMFKKDSKREIYHFPPYCRECWCQLSFVKLNNRLFRRYFLSYLDRAMNGIWSKNTFQKWCRIRYHFLNTIFSHLSDVIDFFPSFSTYFDVTLTDVFQISSERFLFVPDDDDVTFLDLSETFSIRGVIDVDVVFFDLWKFCSYSLYMYSDGPRLGSRSIFLGWHRGRFASRSVSFEFARYHCVLKRRYPVCWHNSTGPNVILEPS